VDDQGLVEWLRQAGVRRGDLAGLVVAPDGAAVVALGSEPDAVAARGPEHDRAWTGAIGQVAAADEALRPRWATWSQETARQLVAADVRLATCWDVAAVHRLIHGGWRADAAWAWAHLRELPLDGVPPEAAASHGPPDLFSDLDSDLGSGQATADSDSGADDAGAPIGPDGYLRPDWSRGGWARNDDTLRTWAWLAREVAQLQLAAIERLGEGSRGGAARGVGCARSESTAELMCAELAADGLPVDRNAAEELLATIIGPRPRSDQEARSIRAARDAGVLKHASPGSAADLRSPLQVKALLTAAGFDVPDTRAWRLEPFKDENPLVAALLEWRKAERIATTYGYSWLDTSLGENGRLRGSWTGSDGAAGRMTASAGLHNMPAVLRQAVLAEPGHLFIRADLGQIEPRVLATVSGDKALAAATRAADMYLPVAAALGVDRPTAKVAMIAAMYGQTTGHGGEAGRRMRKAYPVAMAYLDDADRAARNGHDLRTYGGRLVKMSEGGTPARVAARGRYGRNALIQGAAAELFKMWAVTARARGLPIGARIVLCLHDELLVHVPEDNADATVKLVGDCLAETAKRWAPGGDVAFVADISVVRSWADAKAAKPQA
jgi:DNA polymerase I